MPSCWPFRAARSSAVWHRSSRPPTRRPVVAFNLGSPKQLQEILFGDLELPVVRKTPKGQPSTAEDVLQELAGEYALPRMILEHRGLAKLKSTYTDRLPEKIHPRTGSHPHPLSPGCRRNRQAVVNRSESAEYSDSDRRRGDGFARPLSLQKARPCWPPTIHRSSFGIMAHLSDDERLLEAFAKGRGHSPGHGGRGV